MPVSTTSSPCKCCGGTYIAGYGCKTKTGTGRFVGFSAFTNLSETNMPPKWYRRCTPFGTITGEHAIPGEDTVTGGSAAEFNLCHTGSQYKADTPIVWSTDDGSGKDSYVFFTTIHQRVLVGDWRNASGLSDTDANARMIVTTGGNYPGTSALQYVHEQTDFKFRFGGSFSPYTTVTGNIGLRLSHECSFADAMTNWECTSGISPIEDDEDCCTYTTSLGVDRRSVPNFQKIEGQSLTLTIAIAGATVANFYEVTATFIESVYSTGIGVGTVEATASFAAPEGFFSLEMDAPTPDADRILCLNSITITDALSGQEVVINPDTGNYKLDG